MEILTLWPLSAGEIDGVREGFVDEVFGQRPPAPIHDARVRPALLARVMRGGYPEVVSLASAARRWAWFGSYLTTLLQRDVRDLSNIEGLTGLPRLLALLAARTTSLLNYAEVSRSMGLPQSTLKRYMALLEATFLVQALPAWPGSLSRRLVRSSKLLLHDTGLIAHLLGLDAERLSSDPALSGPLVENFVAMELRKQLGWSQTQAKLFHVRTQTGQGVDIVLEDAAGRLVGIEVKAAGTVTAADLKGLRALAEATGRRFLRGIVLYTGSETVPFAKNMCVMPASAVWRLGATGAGSG
jgi:predicted AAA+ superfamily ATPase